MLIQLLNKVGNQMEQFNFTKRVKCIFSIAESLSSETKIIHPIHLFLGASKVSKGLSIELNTFLLKQLGKDYNQLLLNKYRSYDESTTTNQINRFYVSCTTMEIISLAKQKMERYKQIYLNEGNLLSAILEKDNELKEILGSSIVQEIISFATIPRDLTVQLRDFSHAKINQYDFIVRRAAIEDYQELIYFVENEFGHRWIRSIKNGFFKIGQIPIFIALEDKRILGFACYDVVRNKKGIFGPMGTLTSGRSNGIGKTLLHYCLSEMKSIGYEYAIIGEAGPIEFYERSCNAKLIPIQDD
jgi:Acetyltransferase (GNAT) family